MNADFLNSASIFQGEATATFARLYAQLPWSASVGACSLAGRVTGPRCRWARTLSATAPLKPVASGAPMADLLAEAIVPDPCFWTPELPMLYEVEVELRGSGEAVATCRRTFGFRSLGVRGTSFYLEGRRWVVRGMRRDAAEVAPDDLAQCRDLAAALWIDQPTVDLLRQASEIGVPLLVSGGSVARQSSDPDQTLEEWPGVLFSVSQNEPPLVGVKSHSGRGIVHLQQCSDPAQADVGSWADGLVAGISVAEHALKYRSIDLPIVAYRPEVGLSLAEGRAACDDLQRDLAVAGDFAGYLV